MAYQSLKLTGGTNTEETASLNVAGISSSQLIRFKPDTAPYVLIEKLGGWSRFLATQVTSVIRALLAWEDTNANKWLAYGTSSTTASQLIAIQCLTNASGMTTASGQAYTLTPQYLSDSTAVNFQTVSGSSTVTIIDNVTTGLSTYDSVFITTPVSVGGLILFGQYAITFDTINQYTITATNILGTPALAAYTTIATPIVVTGGTLVGPALTLTFASVGSPPFITNESINITGINPPSWNGSCIVTSSTATQVVLIAPLGATSTYVSGGSLSNYGSVPILTTTANSPVVTVTFPDHGQAVGSTFSILDQSSVDVLTLYGNYLVSAFANSYSFTINAYSNATNAAAAYLGAKLVTGGVSTVSAVTLNLASAYTPPVIMVTGGSSSTTAVTLTWTIPYTFTVGKSITVSGANPAAWNGTFTATGSTSTSVTYALVGSALAWVSGGTVQSPAFSVGSWIQVSGVSPSSWNGNFVVTGSTPNTVTYALSGSVLSWTGNGSVADIGGDVTTAYSITQGPAATALGYGAGGYGVGGYGTAIPSVQTIGSSIFASNWSLDNWGEYLLASPLNFAPVTYSQSTITYSPIYAWDPSLRQPEMVPLTNGPVATTGFFVAMPQRQIIAWGTTFAGIIDPLLVRWCDVSNFNVWVGQTTNQAGSYRLATGSAIIGALQVSQQGLLWTDIGLWSMQYIGPPFIYSFNQLGLGCGLIARRAMGVLNGTVFWMGSKQFFTYSANGVQPILCPVWDAVFQQLDQGNLAKITTGTNALFEEISWFYPVVGGNGENSNYVKYNTLTGMWDTGVLDRTAWIDNSIVGAPIAYSPVNQYVYQHETSPDADGQAMASSFTTGYFAIAEGEDKAFLDECRPDFKWGYYNQNGTATVQITFNAVDYSGQSPTTYGPYALTQATQWFNPRIRSRLLSITVASSDTGSFWRTGAIRYRVVADGRY